MKIHNLNYECKNEILTKTKKPRAAHAWMYTYIYEQTQVYVYTFIDCKIKRKKSWKKFHLLIDSWSFEIVMKTEN